MRSLSINLTMEMTQIRNQIVSSRLSGTAVIQRARCILLAQRLIKFVEISRIVDLSAKAVARWFRRFAESIEALRHDQRTSGDLIDPGSVEKGLVARVCGSSFNCRSAAVSRIFVSSVRPQFGWCLSCRR